MEYLHNKGIAHKDLKLSNVLLVIEEDLSEVIKLSDFGISRIRFNEKKNIIIKDVKGVGSPLFMSPQVLRLFIFQETGKKVDILRQFDPFKADMWSLGVILYIMICANSPFTLEDESYQSYLELYQQMKREDNRYELSPNTIHTYSKECLDLISQLIEPDANKRLDIKLVLQHGWLNSPIIFE